MQIVVLSLASTVIHFGETETVYTVRPLHKIYGAAGKSITLKLRKKGTETVCFSGAFRWNGGTPDFAGMADDELMTLTFTVQTVNGLQYLVETGGGGISRVATYYVKPYDEGQTYGTQDGLSEANAYNGIRTIPTSPTSNYGVPQLPVGATLIVVGDQPTPSGATGAFRQPLFWNHGVRVQGKTNTRPVVSSYWPLNDPLGSGVAIESLEFSGTGIRTYEHRETLAWIEPEDRTKCMHINWCKLGTTGTQIELCKGQDHWWVRATEFTGGEAGQIYALTPRVNGVASNAFEEVSGNNLLLEFGEMHNTYPYIENHQGELTYTSDLTALAWAGLSNESYFVNQDAAVLKIDKTADLVDVIHEPDDKPNPGVDPGGWVTATHDGHCIGAWRVSDWIIRRTKFYNVNGAAIEFYHGGGDRPEKGMIIEANVIYDCRYVFTTGRAIAFTGATNEQVVGARVGHVVRNNWIGQIEGDGIALNLKDSIECYGNDVLEPSRSDAFLLKSFQKGDTPRNPKDNDLYFDDSAKRYQFKYGENGNLDGTLDSSNAEDTKANMTSEPDVGPDSLTAPFPV